LGIDPKEIDVVVLSHIHGDHVGGLNGFLQENINADKILLVMGGFHLGAMGKPQLEKIIVSFRKLGVQEVGPCHCTGDVARQMLKEAYGSHCMNVGVGRLIGFD